MFLVTFLTKSEEGADTEMFAIERFVSFEKMDG